MTQLLFPGFQVEKYDYCPVGIDVRCCPFGMVPVPASSTVLLGMIPFSLPTSATHVALVWQTNEFTELVSLPKSNLLEKPPLCGHLLVVNPLVPMTQTRPSRRQLVLLLPNRKIGEDATVILICRVFFRTRWP
jgi:hypothetical protein